MRLTAVRCALWAAARRAARRPAGLCGAAEAVATLSVSSSGEDTATGSSGTEDREARPDRAALDLVLEVESVDETAVEALTLTTPDSSLFSTTSFASTASAVSS